MYTRQYARRKTRELLKIAYERGGLYGELTEKEKLLVDTRLSDLYLRLFRADFSKKGRWEAWEAEAKAIETVLKRREKSEKPLQRISIAEAGIKPSLYKKIRKHAIEGMYRLNTSSVDIYTFFIDGNSWVGGWSWYSIPNTWNGEFAISLKDGKLYKLDWNDTYRYQLQQIKYNLY